MDRRTPHRWPFGLLAAACALSAPACISFDEPVALVGDSITALTAPQLEERLGDGWDPAIEAKFGYTVAEMLPDARSLAESDPEQVIINLGSNDALRDLPVEESAAALAEMVDLFGDARCIHLVNVNEHMIVQDSGEPATGAVEFNDALESLIGGNSRLRMIDWNAAMAATLDDGDPPTSTLTADSIHPTEQGNDVLADMYEDALAGCPPEP